MINHNLLMYDLFDRKFSVNYGGSDWVVNYCEGDLFELANKLNESSIKYPIIWLQMGYSVKRDRMKGTVTLQGCKIFLITLGDLNSRFKQRFEGVYDDFLYKILLNFDKTIDKTKGINSSLIDDIRTFPLNDIAELAASTKGQEITIQDIWDAIELSTDIEIINECFPQFKINL